MDVDPQPPQEQQQHQSAPMNAAEGAAGTPAANASAALLMGFAGAPASTFPPAAPLAAAPPQQQQQQDPSSLAHLLASGPAHVLAPAPVAPVEPTAAVAAASSHAPSPLPAPTTTPAPSASDASLPPAPTLLPPSHPLAPPPEPFADAQPTVPGTAFDAPSLPPTPGAAPAADTASSAFPPPMNGSASLPPSASATEAQAQPPAAVSLKRDSPDNDEGPTQAGPPLSTPASGGPPAGMGDLLNGSSADEHAAKRAKLEEPTSLPPSALDQTAAPASSHAGGLAPTPQAVPEQQQQQPPQAFASLLAPTSQPPYNPAAAAPAAAPTPAPSVAQQPYPVDPYGAGGLPAQYALHPSPTPAPQTAGVAQQQPVHQPQPWEAPAPGSQPVTAPPASFAPGQQQGFPAPHQQPYTPHQQQQQYGSPAPVPHASSSGLVTPSTPAAAGAYANGHYSQTGPSLPLSHAQQKFFLGLCRQLKKLPQAYAFSAPVDPIALGIPHYHQIITHPMDLSTIEIKLQASGPKGKGKKGGVPGRYAVKEEVVEDFRRVWGNSDRFNGRDHAVSNAGRALEEVFERELARLPADEEPKPPTPKPTASYPAYPAGAGGPTGIRRDSDAARPKRDVHPPPAKDTFLSANDPGRRKSGGGLTSGKKGRFDEQFRYLRKEIDACFKGKGAELCWPFLAPVDPVAMGIPEYPTIVKRPMDLSTVRANLADNIYDDPVEVNQDVKLMLRNCFSFNPPGTAVYDAGKAVEAYWAGRWKHMPAPPPEPVESESEYEADSADEKLAAVKVDLAKILKQKEALEARIASRGPRKKIKKSSAGYGGVSSSGGAVSSSVAPSKPKAPKPPKPSTSSGGAPSSSKPKKQPSTNGPAKKSSGMGRTMVPVKRRNDDSDDDRVPARTEVTIVQKQELAEKIQHCEGDVLNKAISIIQDSMPGNADGSEEIELDIDSLPAAVVLKLYNLVVRGPRKKPGAGVKSARGGTGGLNRKSMDESAESEKIALLEAKMRAFENSGAGGQPQGADDDDESGSDSASDSD